MSAESQRTCPSCGNELSGAMEFCPVCMFRWVLPGAAQSGDFTFENGVKPTPEQPAQRFEHYELVTGEDGKPVELGRGAMGVTYKALDVNLRCPVTLKVISGRYLGDESARLRFLREARAAASVRHPNVASVFHLGRTGSSYFYAMEFVEGETLQNLIKRTGRLAVKLALEIATQVAAGLAAIHEQHLVHRDIKPTNIMVRLKEGSAVTAKIIDLGLAKTVDESASEAGISSPGAFAGTPEFASPEQFTGIGVDVRSDLYSLGVVLWEMLTGHVVFRGSPGEVMYQHQRTPLPLNQLEDVPQPVVVLLQALLEKDPARRFQSPDELLKAIPTITGAIGARRRITRQSLQKTSSTASRAGIRKPPRRLTPKKISIARLPVTGSDGLRQALEPWDFTPFMMEKLKGFIGREWLFREIDEWCSNDHPAALLIVGEPGIGKSAIIAALVYRNLKDQVLAYHCCRTETPATLEPARFVRSLASMLASQLKEYASMIEGASIDDLLRRSDPVSAFEAAILAPLHRIRQPEKPRYYLLIDGLDEALTRAPPPAIVDVLSTRIDGLPSWVRLIATTRNDPGVLRQLRGLRAHVLSAQDPRNQDDVRRFVRYRLREPILCAKAKESQKIFESLENDLLRASAGNFLFVKTALDAIEVGQLSFEHLENLPPGLSSLYDIFFRRLFADSGEDFDLSRKVLETVAAAREPLTREQIAAATDLDPEEELPPILSRLASFVPPSKGRYALFHKSLFDWLTGWDFQQDQPFAAEYHVNLQKGQARLADLCWAEYQRGHSNISPYCIRHLPTHLYQLSRGQHLSIALTDFDFLQAKLQETDASALIADYEYLPVNADLRLVQLAIQLSAHVLARDYRQLAGQLTGRLLGNSTSDIQAVLKGAAETKVCPWLKPLKSSLAPPGGPLIRTLEGHTCWVHALALTPDGRYAISGSGDAILRMWDLEGNQPPRCFTGHKGPIKSVAITPDGRRVVSASSDQTLRVWELQSGRSLRVLRGHCNPVSLVIMTLDGYRAVSVSSDGTLRVWDLESGRPLYVLIGHTGLVNALALLPDGHHAISASSDRTLRVWNLDNGQLVHTLEGHFDTVNAVAVTPDGHHAISASSDHMLRFWDLDRSRSIRTLEGHSAAVTGVAITPNGRLAISASTDHTLRIWDLNTGLSRHTLEGHTNSVTTVVLFSGERRALTGSPDHTLRLWDLKTGKSVRTLAGHTDWVTAAAVTPDGRRAISGSADHTLRLWDLEKDQSAHTRAGQTDSIIRILLTPDGHRAVVTSDCHLLSIWDLESGQLLHTLTGHTDWITAVAVTPDGRNLISGSADRSLRLWNLENGESVPTFTGHTGIVTAVAITPDCRRAISASADHTLRIWDLRVGQPLYTWAGGNAIITAVALTPDGKCAVWGSNTGAVSTWNSESRETACVFAGNRRWMTSIAVTPDGEYAISVSASRTLQVWNLKSREFIHALEGHTDLVNVIVVTADGRLAISASADHSLHIWDIETGDRIAAFSGEGPMLGCAVAPDGRTIVARDKSGRGHLLRIEGLE